MSSTGPRPENISCREADIAIIGLACRFPGANGPDAFWRNLRDGVESISFFSDAELLEAGVDPDLIERPNYVRANGVVSNCELFDAAFFGYAPREAEIVDPQQRLFLECASEAIDNAGFNPELGRQVCGMYAGVGLNTYLLNYLVKKSGLVDLVGAFPLMLANDKDYLATRVSYKLNLKGPSITVQTACSTSLVAVHLACQALLAGECDLALAGAVSIRVPQINGYLHEEGMILSPDGHCRAFDARGAGIVGGNGVGIVVLKRLANALAERDYIHAVIRGSAINNDGAAKFGYTAPGADGQQAVISEAMAVAEIEPDTIGYIEAHGTGTSLGDPVEIAALARAFRRRTDRPGFCAIGSVKTNIGHLDTAAGIAGLIKTVLALKHRAIPPSLHFERPNPEIDFAKSPFYVNARLSEWTTDGGLRRAGVSSFGIGGTNAHVILEEAPPREFSQKTRSRHLLLVSAKTEIALSQAATNLAGHLREAPNANLADVAFTLSQGRRAFNCRRFAVCSSREEAIAALIASDVKAAFCSDLSPEVFFLFSGQGSQHTNMGLELYGHEPAFREHIDLCAQVLGPHLKLDLRQLLYPAAGAPARDLTRTSIAQPALFSFSYALSQLWMEWGIRPSRMIGHSIGEYVAACLADVFSFEDALSLVALRGKLMQSTTCGKMLAVALPETEVYRVLNEEFSLAAVNGPCSTVVSGPADSIEALAHTLSARALACTVLNTSHAFHSRMMEPILEEFAEAVRKVGPRAPKIPYVSNVSGTWITDQQATDPRYWANHLRQTVRFSDGLETLFRHAPAVLLEVGPDRTLANLAMKHPAKSAEHTVLASLGRPGESPLESTLTALGKVWLAGVKVDWRGFYSHETRSTLPLPTYPFQRQRYWVDGVDSAAAGSGEIQPRTRRAIDDWFYLPSWRRCPLLGSVRKEAGTRRWLFLVDGVGLGMALARQMVQIEDEIILVRAGCEFRQLRPGEYVADPAQPAHYAALLDSAGNKLKGIVHLWSMTAEADAAGSLTDLKRTQTFGFYSLILLAQELRPAKLWRA